jgi:hypothetical protein
MQFITQTTHWLDLPKQIKLEFLSEVDILKTNILSRNFSVDEQSTEFSSIFINAIIKIFDYFNPIFLNSVHVSVLILAILKIICSIYIDDIVTTKYLYCSYKYFTNSVVRFDPDKIDVTVVKILLLFNTMQLHLIDYHMCA